MAPGWQSKYKKKVESVINMLSELDSQIMDGSKTVYKLERLQRKSDSISAKMEEVKN